MRQIGVGGMGEVFEAHDMVLDRAVAIKLIPASADRDGRRRFLLEARAIARLHHPNVVAIHRFGEVDERPYLVTELVRGRSLVDVEMPLGPEGLLAIATGIAAGLGAAHREGVLHRDIKPANVLLDDQGEVRLVDFGLAELVHARRDEPRAPDPRYTAGTPLYMAPELFLGEPATFRSDVYALGALLYHLATARPPYDAETPEELAQLVMTGTFPPLAKLVPHLDPRLRDVVERCLERDAGERWSSAEEVRQALEAIAASADPSSAEVDAERNPYPGLGAFEAEDRALFFGREHETRAILERLQSASWVLVAADSGIGKSSLCRAGVLPAVRDGLLADGRAWTIVTVVPGARPLTVLTTALARALGVDEVQLANDIAADLNAVGRALAGRLGKGAGVIVFVDQLEELVTLSEPMEAAAFAEVVDALGGGAGVRVLSTARLDFLTRLAPLFKTPDRLNDALYVLGPLGRQGVRDAIVKPAATLGVHFESEQMIDVLVASATSDGGLPLLQFALAELWRLRDTSRQVISAAALDAIGGVAGALSLHADNVLARLTQSQRAAARQILGRLVTTEGLRARATDADLETDRPDRGAVVDAFVKGRLLIAREAGDETAYEVAHEALIHGWRTLREWLAADVELRELQARVAAAAAEWERLGRGREGLWRERQLAETSRIEPGDLGAREAAFVEASRQHARRRRRQRLALLIGVPALVALVYAAIQWKAAIDLAATVDGYVAETRAAMVEARRQDHEHVRLANEAFAAFDAQELERGERLWASARELAEHLDGSYAAALRTLDSALLLDGTRTDVRAAIGDLLYARADLAQRLHDVARSSEYLARLELFDDGGERLARWRAPARVEVAVSPPEALLSLQRIERSPDGRKSLAAARDLGAGTEHVLELAPGDYLISATAEGRAPVRYPLSLERGEHRQIRLDAPPADAVPPGFVYIPSGRFLFGYSLNDSLRREFFSTVPLHPVDTPAYLIARDETTWADWIAYLDALPADERAARTPKIATVGFHGAIALEEISPGRWRLSIQPNRVRYTAEAGEMLTYQGRRQRARQDWLRLPVSGISADDARAYTAWLARTGRVPEARLCTELEWERAARGADDRIYPHGDRLAPDDANFDETYGKEPEAFGPDEVGAHPASTSVFGLNDMSGNVWEWTAASIGEPGVAARGGSFYFARLVDTVVNRQQPGADFRDLTVGMRVCADAPW